MLGGCFLPNAAKKPTGGATGALREGVVRGKLPGVTGKPVAAPATTTATGGSLVSNNGAGVISNNSGSLSGVVRAPASLISNNGGGIISNNSGGYRVRSFRLLSTVSEVAVAKAKVTLLDAEGKQLLGTDGKPIVTETDAQGHYSFKGILPANNLLVAVVLAGDKGTLKAIAPKGGGDTRKADLNLISTLTTGYILNQYVNTQANRQSTLDKLPPSVESETRAKAATAFNESGASVPDKLTDASVVQTVTTMRQKSEVFNAQMEDVKKLLIAAGQSDLGSGRPALEVSFDWVNHLLLDASGKLLIACNYDRRLWRIDANGNLVTAAGKGGTASLASPNGINGPDAALARFASVTSDAQGRALILEESLNYEDDAFPDASRLTRLNADGKLTELAARIPNASFALPGAGDEVLVLAYQYDEEEELASYELWSVMPGAAPVKKHTFSAGDSELLEDCERITGDGQGRLFVVPYGLYDEATDTSATALYKLEAGGTALIKVAALPDDVEPVLDSRGNVFIWNYETDTITVRKADGTTAPVLSPVPAAFGGGSLDAAVLAPDGTAYISWGAKVYKVVAGKATAIAGTGEGQATGGATTVAVAPSGMSVAPSGEIFFSGLNDSAIYRIGTDKQVKLFAGSAAVGDGEEEEEDETPTLKVGPALQVDLTFPRFVQTDAAGNVYFSDTAGDFVDGGYVSAARVCKVDAAGQLTEAFRLSEPGSEVDIEGLSVAPDGTLYMVVISETEYQGDDEAEEDAFEPARTVRLMRKAPGAAATTLKTDADAELILSYALAATADGLYVAGTATDDGLGTLSRWTAARGFEALKTDARFKAWDISMQADKAGRLYIASGDNRVYRYDVAAGTFKTIAGKGGTHFAGTSVDTSIDAPGYPSFDKDGNLFFADTGHRQIKRIPASEL
jgi:hypothetical protein